MNTIEKLWMPIHIAITNNWNRPHTIERTERAWKAEWDAVHQNKICAIVVRITAVNTLILECEGGNEFHS